MSDLCRNNLSFLVVKKGRQIEIMNRHEMEIEKENYEGFFNTLAMVIKKYGRACLEKKSNNLQDQSKDIKL